MARPLKEQVQALAAQGAAVDRADETYGATPLSVAAHNGHTPTVAWLAAHGAALDRADKHGATPLYAAAESGHTPTVERLAAQGAAVDLGKYVVTNNCRSVGP